MHQSAVSLRSRSQEYSDNLGKVGMIIWKKWRYLQCASPSGCASTCSWNVVTTPTILTVAAFFAALTIGLVWAFNVALLACKNNRERTTLKVIRSVFFGEERERIKADHYPFVSDHDKKGATTTQQYSFWQLHFWYQQCGHIHTK